MAIEWYGSADRASEEILRRLRGAVVSEVRTALREVREELAEYYERLAVGGVLTHAEMMRYNRLSRLERELEGMVRDMARRIRREIHRDLGYLYEDSYERSARVISRVAGTALVLGVLSRERILASVRSVVSGLALGDRVAMRADDLSWRLRGLVVRGLVRGISQTQMMRDVRELFLWDAVRATRAVNTEAHRVKNEARFAAGQDAIKKGVILEKVWVTAGDDKVRDAHVGMAGQRVAADDLFVEPESGATTLYPGGFNIPELDINCRCDFIWITGEAKP